MSAAPPISAQIRPDRLHHGFLMDCAAIDAPMDYATIQILPEHNRYEAFTCCDNKVEKIGAGNLEKVLPHLPDLNNLYEKGCNAAANYKLELPRNLQTAPPAWFTKATLTRFLHTVGSTDFVDVAKAIQCEISQLEESRTFHLSLYGKSEAAQFSALDASKNELLQALDLRIAAVKQELVAAFNHAVAPTCSYQDLNHLAKFSENFGATDLKNTLCKLLELNKKSQTDNTSYDNESSLTSVSGDSNTCKTDVITQTTKPRSSDIPVKYGVSPAKLAQLERQSSSGSEESSDSSDRDERYLERSRALIRSASPRRSASPMRRVQVGRTGSRRTPAVTIKSLNLFPAREKASSHRDEILDSSEEHVCGPVNKPESNIRRMSVQDAINLFECKQRDQTSDVPQRNSSTNSSLGANKAVFRRWSSGMGDSSTQCQPQQTVSEDSLAGTSSIVDGDNSGGCAAGNLNSDFERGGQNTIEAVEVDVEMESSRESTGSPLDNQAVAATRRGGDERSEASVEWCQQKEVELNQMSEKVLDKQHDRSRKVHGRIGKNPPLEQRGGFYDHYKEKRDQKLRGENARKRAEKEAQFKAMQKVLDERKAQMAVANGNNMVKKHPLQKPQALVKNPQKSIKNPSQLANTKKENSKPSVAKKVSSKTQAPPGSRKSWPSTPPVRTSGRSPAKTPSANGFSSAGPTPTHKKPQSASSLPRSSPKVERSLRQSTNAKGGETKKERSLDGAAKKQSQKVEERSKITTGRTMVAPGDCSSLVAVNPSLSKMVTKKSGVVPQESKPFLRKGSRINSSAGATKQVKKPSPLKEPLGKSKILMECQESDAVVIASALVNEICEPDKVSGDHCDGASESGTHTAEHQQSDGVENFDEHAPSGPATDGLKNMAEFSSKCEEELIISPSAWVVVEESQELSNHQHDDAGEVASPANIAVIGLPSARVRHSLSQMLQEDNSESEATEWGNAENPPTLVFQKDSPKGFKRLLKFARKSKGDGNISGWSSPSVFSEGEDDAEESKAVSKKNSDNLLRKVALHAKNYGQQKTPLFEDQARVSKYVSQGSEKSDKGKDPDTSLAAKAPRSFFSLSAFKQAK